MGVDDRVDVGALPVDAGVHPALHRRRQPGPRAVRQVLPVEVDDADVLGPEPAVVAVARGHGVAPVPGDPDRDVALGGLEVAAAEHGQAHIDDVLAGRAMLHVPIISHGRTRITAPASASVPVRSAPMAASAGRRDLRAGGRSVSPTARNEALGWSGSRPVETCRSCWQAGATSRRHRGLSSGAA